MLYKKNAKINYQGKKLTGYSFGAELSVEGEFVFNTVMSGYEEILTDPSYAGQIIVFSYPHIGNTGINLQDHESQQVYASGVIVADYVEHYSNYRGKTSLGAWLKQKHVPAVSGIDTRVLVQQIRDEGSAMGTILVNDSKIKQRPLKFSQNETPVLYAAGAKHKQPIIVVDMGVKHSILVELEKSGHPIYLASPKTSFLSIQKYQPYAIIFSNGPGDPMEQFEAIRLAKECLVTDIPLLGICLGFQVIALAAGARTTKLVFGHHGANHPVKNLETGRVHISSQNHNYVVDELTLPNVFQVTHRSLFDSTIQGLQHRNKKIVAFQGHPEARPGPSDMKYTIDNFMREIA